MAWCHAHEGPVSDNLEQGERCPVCGAAYECIEEDFSEEKRKDNDCCESCSPKIDKPCPRGTLRDVDDEVNSDENNESFYNGNE